MSLVIPIYNDCNVSPTHFDMVSHIFNDSHERAFEFSALIFPPYPFWKRFEAYVSNQMPPIYCHARFKISNLTGVVPSGTWLTQDGHYVIIGGNGDSIYSRLMAAVGRPDMGSDNPLYANNSQRCLQEAEIMEVWASLRIGSRVPVLGS